MRVLRNIWLVTVISSKSMFPILFHAKAYRRWLHLRKLNKLYQSQNEALKIFHSLRRIRTCIYLKLCIISWFTWNRECCSRRVGFISEKPDWVNFGRTSVQKQMRSPLIDGRQAEKRSTEDEEGLDNFHVGKWERLEASNLRTHVSMQAEPLAYWTLTHSYVASLPTAPLLLHQAKNGPGKWAISPTS